VALALKEIVLDWSDMPEPFTTKILDAARWLSLDPTPAGLLHAKNLRAIIYEYIGPNEGVYETTEALREAADHIFARCNYAGFTEFRVRFDFDIATIVTGDYDTYNFELAFWAPEGDQFDPFLESMLSRFAADPA
jgi:hypothetical protein